MDQLTLLAQFETRSNFLRRIEASRQYPIDSFSFVKEDVSRGTLGDQSVDCLWTRAPEALVDKEAAPALLQEWMMAERLDYYRIEASRRDAPATTTHVIFYDVLEQKEKYRAKERRDPVINLVDIALPPCDWDPPLAQLRALAVQPVGK